MKRVALCIGIDNYSDPEIQDLKCAQNDAWEMHALIKHRLGFDSHCLRNPASGDIYSRITALCASLAAGDLFLFYFAGHGKGRKGDHLLLCKDAFRWPLEQGHSIGTLPLSLIEGSLHDGVHRILILDACRTELIEGSRDAGAGLQWEEALARDLAAVKTGGGNAAPRATTRGSRRIMHSCGIGQYAQELPGREHGLFVTAWNNLIERKQQQGEAIRMGEALVTQLAEEMDRLAARHRVGGGQRPARYFEGEEDPLLSPGRGVQEGQNPEREARVCDWVQPVEVGAGQREPVGSNMENQRPKMGPAIVKTAPTIEFIHGWSREQVQAYQSAWADCLGLPLEWQDEMGGHQKGPEMILIPPGEYLMGAPKDEPDSFDDERPQHQVTISQAFYVGRYAVTFAEYDRYCEAEGVDKPNDKGWGRADRPVINVRWEDAHSYVAWLTGQTGKGYRLPSEAEWEYAARAGTAGPFSFEGKIGTDKANFHSNYSYNGSPRGNYRGQTRPVKSFEPNPWGLYQVHGNVWEWVKDRMHNSYQDAPEDGRAWLDNVSEKKRVARGGSFRNVPWIVRTAARNWAGTSFYFDINGFRLARNISLF